MPDRSSSPGEEAGGDLRRRLVGAALRRSRQHAGYGLAEAAKILDCDQSKISRIETGQRGIRPKELRELLAEYGICGGEMATLMAITDPFAAQLGWWREYAGIIPARDQDLMILEALASEIMIYDNQQVPDLLQTRAYARAVAEADPALTDPAMLDRLAEMSAIRRQVIINERCTSVTAVIGEGSLRQQAGGADTMRGQAQWLAEVSSTAPWVTVQVLPFEAGAQPNRTGPMSILRFADAPGLGVVHLCALNGGVCLTDQVTLADYVRAFSQLRGSALPSQQSARFIRDMACPSKRSKLAMLSGDDQL